MSDKLRRMKNKTIIFLGDGMADEPMPELGGKTPLQCAHTPGMDAIASEGVNGTLLTLPNGYPTSSEVANMSVLGCDLSSEYCGRGPLEAAGRGIILKPDDKAFRLNLTTVENGILTDYSGGHIDQPSADELIALLNKNFGSETIRFYTGVSYRNILVLSGTKFSHLIDTEKPDDNHGEPVDQHLPSSNSNESEETLKFLKKLILEAPSILETSASNVQKETLGLRMANGVWPWSGGVAGSLQSLRDKYGISSAVISAVDVIVGLGKCLGMDVIKVPGATGYIDTNYEGKANAAIEALKSHDFVYLHLEAIDEVSHEQNLKKKIQAIEDFDKKIIQRVMTAVDKNVNMAILPDHPVPLATGKHTRTPVPVAIRSTGVQPDAVTCFDEISCTKGSLGRMSNGDLMNMLFRRT